MKFTVYGQGAHIFLEVESVGHIGGVEHEVECESPGFSPVFVLGANEFFGAKFEGIFFLIGSVGYGVDFGAESFRPQESKVTETTAE